MSTYVSVIELGNGERHKIRDSEAVHFDELLDKVYPVGAIYMSVVDTDPSILFGGVWERWGTGRVPVAVDASNAAFNAVEKTGGVATVTLTAAQSGVPQHTHGFTQPTVPKHTHGFTQPTVPKHTHGFTQPTIANTTIKGKIAARRMASNDSSTFTNFWCSGAFTLKEKADDTNWYSAKASNGPAVKADHILLNAAHKHTASGGAVGEKAAFACTGGAVGEKAAMACTGGAVGKNTAANASEAHTNLQPYITCYMWKRVS